MRVIVVGAGAMGSLFASHLAGTGEEVWVLYHLIRVLESRAGSGPPR